MKNIATFNTIVAEAMDELNGVWEREEREEREKMLYWETGCTDYELDEYESDGDQWLWDEKVWLTANNLNRTVEWYERRDEYSDVYKDYEGIRPRWFFRALREEFEAAKANGVPVVDEGDEYERRFQVLIGLIPT